MAKQLFGTDGIRGVAGEAPLDPKTVYAFGLSLGEWVTEHYAGERAPKVVVGIDTRESGPWLAETVAASLEERGVETRFAGLTTTPGVAYLTRSQDFVAGVMISASHNPYQDNGLKVFDHSGYKLADKEEAHLESAIFTALSRGVVPQRRTLFVDSDLDQLYLNYLISAFDGTLAGMRIVVDCANGAASQLGPELFKRLGAEVIPLACEPDGRNINLNCGALHTENVKAAVASHDADCGIAFDGDADRCMMIAKSGKLIDGDHTLLIAAKALIDAQKWNGGRRAVVATVMSNLGLEKALAMYGIELLRTQVGDKYVLERMVADKLPVGGEQSGHVIFRDFATTGDGLLTALRSLEAVQKLCKTMDDLTSEFFVYPQVLVNVRFKEKRPLESLPDVQAEIESVRQALAESGRVLVRFSGTEPLARVMVEGPEIGAVKAHAQRIAAAISTALG